MASTADEPILNLLKENGEMHSNDICAALTMFKDATVRSRLGKLKSKGNLSVRDRSYYSIPTSAQTLPTDDLTQISNALRAADANKKTIDRLLNIYDSVLDNYETWVADNIGNIDFEQQLLFIENLKWLTGIGDKLMKRWSLEHVGYDTNSRQAQEDAKAKTELREQEALKNAPLEDTIVVVGHYKEGFQEILEHLPKKEVEDISV